MVRSPVKYVAFLSAVSIIAVLCGCQETLPLRDDPTDYFSVTMSGSYDVLYPKNPVAQRNQYMVVMSVVNRFDEVIEGRLEVSGALRIEWMVPKDAPLTKSEPVRTLTVTPSNIIRAAGLDRTTGVLTFAPGDTIVIACAWNYRSNDSTDLFGLFQQLIDYHCLVADSPNHTAYRRVTTRQRFKLSGSVKLTGRTSAFYAAPVFVEQCFVVPYFTPTPQPDGHDCLNENGIDPCKLIE